jgi:hypothetical protein
LIDSVSAVVTFDRFSCFRIPLRGAPGAGGDTALAADAKGFIHKDNSIFCPLLHGTGRAGCHTPWVFTVKAGHEDIGHARQIIDQLGPHRYDLTEPGTNRQIVFCLAVRFTTKTSNAALDILVYIVFAHEYPSSFGLVK